MTDCNTILLHMRLQLILLLLCANATSESIVMKKNCEFVVFVHRELNFACIIWPFALFCSESRTISLLGWVGLCNRDG